MTTIIPDVFHPLLRTARSEIADVCRQAEHNYLIDGDAEKLALAVESAEEQEIARIASKAGENMMNDGNYWLSLPLAAEGVLGVQ